MFCKELVKARERTHQNQEENVTRTVYANNIAQRHMSCLSEGHPKVNGENHHSSRHGEHSNHRYCSRNTNCSMTEASMNSLLEALQTNHNTDHLTSQLISLHKTLRRVDRNTKDILGCLRDKHNFSQIRMRRLEWQIVGATVDRTCFLIFLIAIVSSLLTLFPRPYNLQSI